MEKVYLNNETFEKVFKMVIKEHIKKEIEEYNDITEEDKYDFSPEFEAKMIKC